MFVIQCHSWLSNLTRVRNGFVEWTEHHVPVSHEMVSGTECVCWLEHNDMVESSVLVVSYLIHLMIG